MDERDPTLSFARFTPNSRYILTASLGPDASGLFLWDFDHKVVKKSYEGHTNTRFMLQVGAGWVGGGWVQVGSGSLPPSLRAAGGLRRGTGGRRWGLRAVAAAAAAEAAAPAAMARAAQLGGAGALLGLLRPPLWSAATPATPNPKPALLQATFVVNDPDNRRLVVSGSEDHHVYAWDLQSRHIMGLLRGRESVGAAGEGHTGVVLSVDATAAGEGIPPLIASGGRDQVVKVWEHVGAPAANQAA